MISSPYKPTLEGLTNTELVLLATVLNKYREKPHEVNAKKRLVTLVNEALLKNNPHLNKH